MNIPHEPNEPLLQSLVDEAANLPARAAREARTRMIHRRQWRYGAASSATILLASIYFWSLLKLPEPRPTFVAVPPTTAEADPENPTASTQPIPPTTQIAPEVPDTPGPLPTPMIAASTAAGPPKPNDPRAHPAPEAPSPALPRVSSAALANDPSGGLPHDFVNVQTEAEAMRNPLPLPEGLNQEQQELFRAARGLPLLLVRDSTGKVLRIHVIER